MGLLDGKTRPKSVTETRFAGSGDLPDREGIVREWKAAGTGQRSGQSLPRSRAAQL
jgi:hypothetical protein